MGADFGEGWNSDNKEKSSLSIAFESKTPQKHQLYLSKEKRRGKVVTLVQPFFLEKTLLQALVKILKKKLGTGGTIKENTLEFQGDIPEVLRKNIETLGYRFKS